MGVDFVDDELLHAGDGALCLLNTLSQARDGEVPALVPPLRLCLDGLELSGSPLASGDALGPGMRARSRSTCSATT